MGAERKLIWPLATAWPEAVEIVARDYGVAAEAIAAPARGRGPRPRKEIWRPKQVALYLAAILSGQNYAALARHVGLHRDTVHAHCAVVRELCVEDDEFEAHLDQLAMCARDRLRHGATQLCRRTQFYRRAQSANHPTISPDHEIVIIPEPDRARRRA